MKLKEISYIHAEGYPAGEMKHGPIALIDEQMPVVAIAPRDAVFEKMLGNIQEAKARGGSVIVIGSEGDDDLDRLLDPAAGCDRAAAEGAGAHHADRRRRSAAAACVLRRRPPRLRRRSTAQPREERYGRIGELFAFDELRANGGCRAVRGERVEPRTSPADTRYPPGTSADFALGCLAENGFHNRSEP